MYICFMASVLKVYNALKDISNKEQKGFITPAVFNSFAHIAQTNVYNELFEDFIKAKGMMRQSMDLGRDRSPRKISAEDVSIYIKQQNITSDTQDSEETPVRNIFTKPSDLSRIISIRVSDEAVSSDEGVSCEMVYDVEGINRIVRSNLSAPTSNFPVALISNDIEVFPSLVTEIKLTYYSLPTSYDYGTKNVSTMLPQVQFFANSDVPDPEDCKDFMIPDEFLPEIIFEMCELIGVRLRDQNLMGFGARKEAAE